MGIRDKPIVLASPWQNGFAERLIGSIRRGAAPPELIDPPPPTKKRSEKTAGSLCRAASISGGERL
jgi:hypothetical protein